MPLTTYEHYAISACCFMGGALSVVTHLWLLFDLFPIIRMGRNLRFLHKSLAIANILPVMFFFIGGISHFEQGWIFGPRICIFYVFWCKFSPILAMGVLTVALWASYQHHTNPKLEKTSVSYLPHLAVAFGSALFWGYASITWAKYGQEPAGFTCTVIWYEPNDFITVMCLFGFGIPSVLSIAIAYKLWSAGYSAKEPLTAALIGLTISMHVQYSAYAVAYIFVVFRYKLSLYAIAFPHVWTKVSGIAHPFVYSNSLACSASQNENKKRE